MQKIMTLFLVLLIPSILFAVEPLEGTYKLTGSNAPTGGKTYAGKVTIKKLDKVYKLVWLIGSTQSQEGIAILETNVLSVGYLDSSGRDFGVVSFKVLSPKKIEGKWSSLGSKGLYGVETLEYEGPLKEVSLPASLPTVTTPPKEI